MRRRAEEISRVDKELALALDQSFSFFHCLKSDIYTSIYHACSMIGIDQKIVNAFFPVALTDATLILDPSAKIQVPALSTSDNGLIVELIPVGETYRSIMPVGLFVTTFQLPFGAENSAKFSGIEAIRCYPGVLEDRVRQLDIALQHDGRGYGTSRRMDAEKNNLALQGSRINVWNQAPDCGLPLNIRQHAINELKMNARKDGIEASKAWWAPTNTTQSGWQFEDHLKTSQIYTKRELESEQLFELVELHISETGVSLEPHEIGKMFDLYNGKYYYHFNPSSYRSKV